MKFSKNVFVIMATSGPGAGCMVSTSQKRTDTAIDNTTNDPAHMRTYDTENGAEKFISSNSYRRYVKEGDLRVKSARITIELN